MTTIAATVVFVLMLLISIFQALLAGGAPWGEWAWSGRYQGVLPKNLRVASLISAVFWLSMALVLADYGQIVPLGINRSVGYVFVCILTVLLAIGTVLNAISPSKKESLLWTPISGVCLLGCAYLCVSG